MPAVRFGIQLSARHNTPSDWDELKSAALYCEKLGYDSVWFGDHLTTGGARLECWTLISALSQITSKVGLGTMVLSNGFRNPALLAKMGATLDVISQGRLELGIGTGWHKDEHETYGFDFLNPRARVRGLREGVTIIKKMWTEEKASFTGKYFSIRDAVCEPKPFQKPYPPIMIGGAGEKLTLKVVAACADRCNFGGSVEQYKHKVDVLEKYCKEIGRDSKEIEKTLFSSMDVYHDEDEFLQDMKDVYSKDYDGRAQVKEVPFEDWLEVFQSRVIVGTPEACLERIREFMDLGVTTLIFRSSRQTPDLKKRKENLKIVAEEVISQIRNN